MTNWLDNATQWYDTNAPAFQAGAESCDTTKILTAFTNTLPKGAAILDIGCGTGRDMLWMRENGFTPTGYEPSNSLRTIAQNRGLTVAPHSLHELNDIATWDAIWCLGVFVHIPLDLWLDCFVRIARALKPTGKAFISLKEGVGETTDSQGRPLARMTRSDVQALLKQVGKFTIQPNIAPASNGTQTQWLDITLSSSHS